MDIFANPAVKPDQLKVKEKFTVNKREVCMMSASKSDISSGCDDLNVTCHFFPTPSKMHHCHISKEASRLAMVFSALP